LRAGYAGYIDDFAGLAWLKNTPKINIKGVNEKINSLPECNFNLHL